MQSCCGFPLRAPFDVSHYPLLPTSRFRLPPFSSLSSPSSSSAHSSSPSSMSSSSSPSSSTYKDTHVALALPIGSFKNLINLPPKPHPHIALISLLLVLSMFSLDLFKVQAFGAFLSLAILSIPTIKAFRRLAASVEQLSQVVSQEVPGTLTSLRLSGQEIHQLTLQLATLRQKISSSPLSKKHRNSKSSSFRSNKDQLS